MDFEDAEDLFVTLSLDFKAIRVIENQLIPTTWQLKTQIIWNEVEDLEDQEAEDRHDYATQLAITKTRFWFDHMINGSVLFSRNNEWALRAFLDDTGVQTVQNHLVVLPDDPVDSLLAEIFQSKMNAFAAGALEYGYVDLTADDTNGFSFLFVGAGEYNLPSIEEWVGPRSHFSKPWWARNDASTIDVIPEESDDLKIPPSFAYSLDFLGDGLRGEQTPTARIIKPEFRPEVINGGKK